MQTIQERLALFLTEQNITMQKFERQCDMGVGAASKLTAKSYATTYAKITKAFPMLNIHWLKTGEGEMLNSPKGDVVTMNGGRRNIGKVGGNVDQRQGTFYDTCPDDATHIRELEKEIENLRAQLAHKDDLIAEMRNSMARQDAIISRLEKMNDSLMSK